MSRNPLRVIRSLWLRFLDGPQWLRESHGLGFVFKYYRSPTLKLLFWAMAWYERMFSRPMYWRQGLGSRCAIIHQCL